MKNLIISLLCLVMAACCGAADNENLFPNSGDVGAVKHPGSVSFDAATGVYTITGAGTNMWATDDEFFMTWREVTGDFTLSADIAFEGEGVNTHRKMGLIIRDGLASNAVYADIAVHGGDGLTSLQYRETAGAETLEAIARPSGSALPRSISLRREGDKLFVTATQETPDEGISTAEATLELPEKCLVGLFICSHEADVSETGYFSNVKFDTPQ